MNKARVNLYETGDSGITDIMEGPWKAIQVVALEPRNYQPDNSGRRTLCFYR